MKKKKIQKRIAWLLSVLLIVGVLPTSAFAAETDETAKQSIESAQVEATGKNVQSEIEITQDSEQEEISENLEDDSPVEDETSEEVEKNAEEEITEEPMETVDAANTEHTREEAVQWVHAQEGKSLDYDGAYGAQCVDLIKYYYAYFGKASYARGNGCDYVSNALPDGWIRIKNTATFVPEPGDIAVWGTELSKSGHVAIILSADVHSFVSMDQNWPSGSPCKQVTHTYSKFWGVIRPSFAEAVPQGHNPVGRLDSAEGGLQSVTVRGWAIDEDDYGKALDIHVYLDGEGIGITTANQYRPDVNNVYGCGEYHGYEATFSLDSSITGEHTVTVYAINTGGGNSNPVVGSTTVNIRKDTEAPVISDYKVTGVTTTGYIVSCKVTDNLGVDRVQFPTWTQKDEQDDIIANWGHDSAASGSRNGDIFTYQVNIADHNNEKGLYNTHIYAYDKNGNTSYVAINSIELAVLPDISTEFKDDFYAKIQNASTGTVLTRTDGENQKDACFSEDTGSRNQIWHFAKNAGNDSYTISSEDDEVFVLDVSAGLDEEKRNVQVWTRNGSEAQKWGILDNNGNYCLKPGCAEMRVLDTPGGQGGTQNAQIYSYNSGTGVGMNLVEVKPTETELQKDKIVSSGNYNKHHYEVLDQEMSWSDAKCACEEAGGHLVTITDAGEQKFVESLFEKAGMKHYWIGMYRNKNTYAWITGEESEYTNWNQNEPNGITEEQAKEYCAEIYNTSESKGFWNDLSNVPSEKVGIICEYDSVKNYTITYDANGGKEAPEQKTDEEDAVLTISDEKPIYRGYEFVGWATKKEAKEAEYQAGDEIKLTGDVTLYAVWIKVEITGICGKGLTWTLGKDGGLTVSGTGVMTNYTYKSEMPWYQYRDQIQSVVIGEEVTSIGDYAFYGLPNLTKVTIPKGLTAVGSYAFKNCTGLTDVQLPTTLKKLGESAFYGCSALREIVIPEGLYTVWGYTFKNCTSLEKVVFPLTLIKIDEAAFYGCTSLKTLTIPDHVSIIGIYCFKNCTRLKELQLPAGIQQIREAAFYGTALTELKVPDQVTKIGAYAFKNCTELKEVKLSKALKEIGDSAFYACSGLTALNLPDTVTDIKDYAFRKCTGLKNVNFSAGLKTIGESSFYGCENLTELNLPEGVTDIKGYAFKGCTGVTEVTLPTTLKTIGESAFYACSGISRIEIPKSVTSVGDYGFSRCTKLSQVSFKGNAPAIGANAFAKVSAKINYPSGDVTWSKDKQKNYGGTLSWSETK